MSHPIQITYKGKRFKTLTAAAEYYGVNPITAGSRLQKGYSLKDVFSLEGKISRDRARYTFFFKGKRRSILEISKLTGIKRVTLYKRLILNKQTIKEATENLGDRRILAVQNSFRIYDYLGKKVSLSDLERATGVSVSVISRRMKHGFTLNEAISMKRMPCQTGFKQGRFFTFKKEKLNLNDWGKKYGVSREYVRQLVEKNPSFREVIAKLEARKNK